MMPLNEAMQQAREVEKWKLAERMIPILKRSFVDVVPGVELDNGKFDLVMETVESQLPRAISNSEDLSERAQVELLSMLSMVLRQRQFLRDPKRRKQLIGVTVGVLLFGVRALSFLGVTIHGVPIRQWLVQTGTDTVPVMEAHT